MAKQTKNDTQNTEVVEETTEGTQGTEQSGEGNAQGTQGEDTSVEKTVVDTAEAQKGDDEEKIGKETPKVDSGAKGKGAGKKGTEAGNKVEKTKVEEPKAEEPTVTEKRNKIAKEVFQHTTKTKLFFTSDMIPFYEENDALKHSRGLKDTNIVTVNKE